ncbi:aspartate--tRNA(Asn) ligase [Fusibacter ferrireducens]|uniref:Aspartate--tRNA ligase n=1 Tax=Fusibacter ferrireducens TaxID=2785058 RepID=A0ABR9ZZW1_9FIRM|nr:aspartate--tRNA(Asn) ligase [Fusibacter ferrireducens]MBF4695718.1 aspartate--tRNA(Asn) ligase [Fusibacter ferrireducens]
MMRILSSNLKNNIGESVLVKGWVHRIRILKSVTFIILRDRSGCVQCVFEGKPEWTKGLKIETVVAIEGLVCTSNNQYQSVEIQGKTLEIQNEVAEDLPIQINGDHLEVNLETILNNRVLALRHFQNQAIFKLQALIVAAFRQFLEANDFLEMFTPKIVKEGAEGGAEIFKLNYFGETAYLAQSPQFYKQMMVIAGFERVFEVGSVYRAEQHSTNRHLNEYVSMDFEMGFIEDEYEVMAMEEKLLKFMFQTLAEKGKTQFEALGIQCPVVPDIIPKLKMKEAIEILKTHYQRHELDGDLDPQGEREISAYVKTKYGSEFVFITHYPKQKRPMYTKCYDESDETHSFDLLFRGLEITTGGQRINEKDILIERMVAKGLDPTLYSSYLEAFKYGAPAHGGLAIGLERLTAQIMDLSNVRLASLFPRDQQRLLP